MRRSADEIAQLRFQFGRKCLAIRHRLLTEFFPPIVCTTRRQPNVDSVVPPIGALLPRTQVEDQPSWAMGRPPDVPRCPSREFQPARPSTHRSRPTVCSSCRCSSVNCLSSLPKSALARCGLRRSRPCADARHRQTVNEWPAPTGHRVQRACNGSNKFVSNCERPDA